MVMCQLRTLTNGPRTISMFFNALSSGAASRKVVRACLLALAAGLAALTPLRAYADCTDAPGPTVDWQRCYQDGRDFAGADLSKAQLRDASFTRAILEKTNFAGADAFGAKFYSARMAGVSFEGARVAEADFSEADLTGAIFRKTDMRGAKLISANLHDADLSGANLRGADLFRAQLGGALWTDGKTRCAEGSVGQCN
jgi:uncharacterized protein YjbI with pentapeptide repeats